MPQVVAVTETDFREFQLPIPGIWRKIVASEATPGLAANARDKTFPARTHVIGIIDPIAKPQVVYLKGDLLKQGLIKNEDLDIFLVAINNTVLGFKNTLGDRSLNIRLTPDKTLSDGTNKTTWDLRGKQIQGQISADLVPIALSDEYWFSWKHFHPDSHLIRV